MNLVRRSTRTADAALHRLVLAPGLRAALAAAAHEAHPDEACGLLLGVCEDRTGTLTARRLVTGTNLAARPRARFELDPGAVVAAEDEARAAGLEVVAVWHSHPDGGARPSRSDREGAHGGWCHVVAAVDGEGLRDLRAWRTTPAGFDEVEVAP